MTTHRPRPNDDPRLRAARKQLARFGLAIDEAKTAETAKRHGWFWITNTQTGEREYQCSDTGALLAWVSRYVRDPDFRRPQRRSLAARLRAWLIPFSI